MKRPRIFSEQQIDIPEVCKIVLKNGFTLYTLPSKHVKGIKFEIIFEAGRSFEIKQMTSAFSHNIISKGAQKYNEIQISEKFDALGSELNHSHGYDFNSFGFFSLDIYFIPLFNHLFNVWMEPTFPENELEKLKKRRLELNKQLMEKNDSKSYILFTESIFGSQHPYGYNALEHNITSINRNDLISHYQNNYFTNSNSGILVGNFSKNNLDYVIKKCENLKLKISDNQCYFPRSFGTPNQVKDISTKKNQVSIKIGRALPKLNTVESIHFATMNTLFGGSFNSKLSTKIREKEGLTYNIESNFNTFLHAHEFYISSDTSQKSLAKLLNICYDELEKIQNILISKNEIIKLKNQMKSTIASMIDGIFNQAETLKHLMYEGQNYEYLKDVFNILDDMTNEDLRHIACKYLHKDELSEFVIG